MQKANSFRRSSSHEQNFNMVLVNYYHLKDGKNAGIVMTFGQWPERVLKHRGWTKQRLVTTRVATQEEHEWLANCMRHQAYRYDSVTALIEDERNFVDENVITRLANAFSMIK